MENRVGTIEKTLKEIQDDMTHSKKLLLDNQDKIDHVQSAFDSKLDGIGDKLTDVFDIVTKLQGTIIFVLATGSMVGAIILTILTAAIGL